MGSTKGSGCGSGCGSGAGGSAKLLVGAGRLRSQGKISEGAFEGGAGGSLGTSYHIFFGGLGYRSGGTNGVVSWDIS